MQEEIENKTVTLIINTAKLTERELMKAMKALLNCMKNRKHTVQPVQRRGKMTVKQLAAQNRGMQSVEVKEGSIASFNRIARKYGIDFAPYKVKGEKRYLVFFKGPDSDAITAAFEEYTAKLVKQASRPSLRTRLEHFRDMIQKPVAERTKHKEIER